MPHSAGGISWSHENPTSEWDIDLGSKVRRGRYGIQKRNITSVCRSATASFILTVDSPPRFTHEGPGMKRRAGCWIPICSTIVSSHASALNFYSGPHEHLHALSHGEVRERGEGVEVCVAPSSPMPTTTTTASTLLYVFFLSLPCPLLRRRCLLLPRSRLYKK